MIRILIMTMRQLYKDYLKKIEKKADEAYEKHINGESKETSVTFVLNEDEAPILTKFYSGDEIPSEKNLQNVKSNDCEILKTFAKLSNLTQRYDHELHFRNKLIGPTFEEDIYDKMNCKLSCNMFFKKTDNQ